jgi:hypothetical protein
MNVVLPDSRGGIAKLLFHHTSTYNQGRQIGRTLFGNLLKSLENIGTKPEVYAFATYRNDSERAFLQTEAENWKSFVKKLEYASIQVSNEMWSKLPYAQDTCLVLDSQKPSAIITKSLRFGKMQSLFREIEKLLESAGLEITRPEESFNFEGGYTYACSSALFYSSSEDRKMLETFGQKPIFIPSQISKLAEEIGYILRPSALPFSAEMHIDLMFSIFERDNSHHVFCVDFKNTILSDPLLSDRQRILLGRRLEDWDRNIERISDIMNAHFKNMAFHRVPGVIGFERNHTLDISGFAASALWVYSGANLLFHCGKKDYAFYLKYPREDEELMDIQINDEIESALKSAGIVPIAISETNESLNWTEIRNSAGARCLVKVLARENLHHPP